MRHVAVPNNYQITSGDDGSVLESSGALLGPPSQPPGRALPGFAVTVVAVASDATVTLASGQTTLAGAGSVTVPAGERRTLILLNSSKWST